MPDITNLLLNAKIKEVKNKTPSITNLATASTSLNAKVNEVKNKIPNVTNLATTTIVTAVEKKIPDHIKFITISRIGRKFYCKITATKFSKQKKILLTS